MIFGYARVSTPQQSLDEQIEKLRRAGAEKIYYEKFTGRTNKRPEFQKLKKRLLPGDEVSELHRLLSQEQQLARTEQAKRLELESVNTRLIETNTDVLNEKDARIQELENKLSKEQNKGFWARIFK